MAKGGQPKSSRGGGAMVKAWEHFDAGDKLLARREAQAVLDGAPSPDDVEQARELLRRTAPPPVFRTLALIAAALIASLILLALFRS